MLKMKVPTSYKEITVSQFMKAYEIMHDEFDSEVDRMAALISYFIDKPFDEVMEMDIEDFKKLSIKLSFLRNDLPLFHVMDFIIVGKKIFTATKSLTQMKVNQMIDFQSIYKNHNNNVYKCLDKLLPIIYVQKEYDPSKHEENVKLLSNAKVSEVSGLVFFYSDFWCNAEKTIQAYTESQLNEIAKRMDWIAKNPQLIPS